MVQIHYLWGTFFAPSLSRKEWRNRNVIHRLRYRKPHALEMIRNDLTARRSKGPRPRRCASVDRKLTATMKELNYCLQTQLRSGSRGRFRGQQWSVTVPKQLFIQRAKIMLNVYNVTLFFPGNAPGWNIPRRRAPHYFPPKTPWKCKFSKYSGPQSFWWSI